MDIDDALLIAAKATAVRRRTTLKAVVEHALRREIEPVVGYGRSDSERCYEVNERGMPYLKRCGGKQVTSAMVYDLMDEEGI